MQAHCAEAVALRGSVSGLARVQHEHNRDAGVDLRACSAQIDRQHIEKR